MGGLATVMSEKIFLKPGPKDVSLTINFFSMLIQSQFLGHVFFDHPSPRFQLLSGKDPTHAFLPFGGAL